MTGSNAYLAIDAGGTYLKSAVLDSGGTVLEGSSFKAEARSEGSREEILKGFVETLHHGLAFAGEKNMKFGGIGVAFPGPFDFSNGISLMEHKFRNIYGIRLPEIFREVPGIEPDIPICFLHDVNAVLLGEQWRGNAQGFQNTAVVTLGTGLGFTYTVDGLLQCNKLGSPAVPIYKLPYRDGILEEYTAKKGILKVYKEISGTADCGGIEVFDIGRWADEGNRDCVETFREVGRILADSLKGILQEKGIQCLLFGGQISRSFPHMEGELKKGLKDVKGLDRITMVKSIDSAALLGALKAVLHPVPAAGK